MRICFLSTQKGTPWGGSEELWAAAADRAMVAGHTVLVSCYHWPERHPVQQRLIDGGAELLLRPRRTGKFARLFSRPAWLRHIERFDPDAIVISQGNGYECAGYRSMKPIIPWLRRSRAKIVNLIQFNSEDTGLGRAAAVRARWLYQRAALNAFVAIDNHRLAEKRLGIKIDRSIEVRNPVNLADTSPLPWPTDSHAARFACVARLDARTKGQDMLLETFGQPAWKARPWTLDCYGVGPDQASFQELAARFGLSDRVRFHGQVEDIRAVWASHHALLLPSRAEGTPLAMVEAMILARPCMVNAVGGCADWIHDGLDGFLSPAPTTPSVADALERLWTARDRWPAIGAAARLNAVKLMGPDPGAAFLDLVLASTSRGRPVTV